MRFQITVKFCNPAIGGTIEPSFYGEIEAVNIATVIAELHGKDISKFALGYTCIGIAIEQIEESK